MAADFTELAFVQRNSRPEHIRFAETVLNIRFSEREMVNWPRIARRIL